jgi:hypothetical protein
VVATEDVPGQKAFLWRVRAIRSAVVVKHGIRVAKPLFSLCRSAARRGRPLGQLAPSAGRETIEYIAEEMARGTEESPQL